MDTLDAWEHHKTPKIENLDAIETLIKKTQSVVAKFLCMRAIIDIAADDNNALLIY